MPGSTPAGGQIIPFERERWSLRVAVPVVSPGVSVAPLRHSGAACGERGAGVTDCEKPIVLERRMLNNIVAKLTLCIVASSFGWKRTCLSFCSADDFCHGAQQEVERRWRHLAAPRLRCNGVTCDVHSFLGFAVRRSHHCCGASTARPPAKSTVEQTPQFRSRRSTLVTSAFC
jgi:hypothetical protein